MLHHRRFLCFILFSSPWAHPDCSVVVLRHSYWEMHAVHLCVFNFKMVKLRNGLLQELADLLELRCQEECRLVMSISWLCCVGRALPGWEREVGYSWLLLVIMSPSARCSPHPLPLLPQLTLSHLCIFFFLLNLLQLNVLSVSFWEQERIHGAVAKKEEEH